MTFYELFCMICEYALNYSNELVYIDDVDNGYACNCTCPCCGEKLNAKNGGKIKVHHFAHKSGNICGGYRETLLHIWSKQIIKEEKKLKIPRYNDNVNSFVFIRNEKKTFNLNEQILNFVSVEVEERNDIKSLQPDIVGVTSDGLRLWIEIVVTHKCNEEKINLIKENSINCIEIKIPNEIDNKEQLREFLLNSNGEYFNEKNKNLKQYINFPYGDKIINDNKVSYLNDYLKKMCKIKEENECTECFKQMNKSTAQVRYENLLNEYNGELKMYKWIFNYKNLSDLIIDKPNIEDWILPSIRKRRDYISSFGHRYYVYLESFARELTIIIHLYKGNLWSYEKCNYEFGYSNKNGKRYVFCLL